MNPEKYNRVKEIFLAACEKPAGERTAYVDQAANDDEIKREVESLLKEYSREKQLMPSEPEPPLGDMSSLLSRAHVNVPGPPNEAADEHVGETNPPQHARR